MVEYEALWKAKVAEENIDNYGFSVQAAWEDHYEDITSERGQLIIFDNIAQNQTIENETK
ncbi:hypothetical protein [Salinispira pacifica]|uniref:Uncharacterized protein n=1 Tax=Salinispira pacifica TaxID=1307761 RepID=V5WHK2_9SPIO|nr:hypothetical protein [Salinispira pacifica]AHC15312.1 hypothetical protein L21SP2_1941 [Salinispira pacifica]